MDEQVKQEFKEFLFQAHQAGKQETSGLVDMVIHKMETKIEESINKNVNGKINALHAKMDNYIVSSNEWRSKAEPAIKMVENVQGFGKVTLYMVGFIGSVGGIFIAIMHFFHDKINQ